MAGRILLLLKTIRNNWKKSVFGAGVLTYGVKYAKDKHNCNVLMTEYCLEALNYGDALYSEGVKIRNVTVFLNPAANKRKAKKEFDKYCAPLLNLAGIHVTLVQTKSQGEARTLAEQLDDSVDAVIVAGGDGTLSEIVTGLLRRDAGSNSFSKRIPVGILPLGQTNKVAKSLFSDSCQYNIKMMADATMAVIKGIKKPVDVIRIQQLEKEQEDQRPVYSVNGITWGAIYDAYAKRDKYWYWNGLRSYMSYIFMGLKGDGKGITWNCNANLSYSLPCSGCSSCYLSHEREIKQKTNTRWWHSFVPRPPLGGAAAALVSKIDYSKIKNETCDKLHQVELSSVEFSLHTSTAQGKHKPNDVPCIEVNIGPPSFDYWDFVTRGWEYIKGNKLQTTNTLQVKDLTIKPDITKTPQDAEHWYYIDNDDYEVRPVYVKLLPRRLLMFCQYTLAS